MGAGSIFCAADAFCRVREEADGLDGCAAGRPLSPWFAGLVEPLAGGPAASLFAPPFADFIVDSSVEIAEDGVLDGLELTASINAARDTGSNSIAYEYLGRLEIDAGGATSAGGGEGVNPLDLIWDIDDGTTSLLGETSRAYDGWLSFHPGGAGDGGRVIWDVDGGVSSPALSSFFEFSGQISSGPAASGAGEGVNPLDLIWDIDDGTTSLLGESRTGHSMTLHLAPAATAAGEGINPLDLIWDIDDGTTSQSIVSGKSLLIETQLTADVDLVIFPATAGVPLLVEGEAVFEYEAETRFDDELVLDASYALTLSFQGGEVDVTLTSDIVSASESLADLADARTPPGAIEGREVYLPPGGDLLLGPWDQAFDLHGNVHGPAHATDGGVGEAEAPFFDWIVAVHDTVAGVAELTREEGGTTLLEALFGRFDAIGDEAGLGRTDDLLFGEAATRLEDAGIGGFEFLLA